MSTGEVDRATGRCAIHPRGSAATLACSVGQDPIVRLRADHDPLAAGPVHRLEHQLAQLAERPREDLRVVEAVGLHVMQQRLLAEVVPDQVGDIRVDQLVISDAVADRVGDGDIALAGGVEQPAQPTTESGRKCSGSRKSSSTRR